MEMMKNMTTTITNRKLIAFQTNTEKYNRCNNYLKAFYLTQALSISYFNDMMDILHEFGLNAFEVKWQANRLNKEFNNLYRIMIKNIGMDSKMELAKNFDNMRVVLDEIFDNDCEIEIRREESETQPNKNETNERGESIS